MKSIIAIFIITRLFTLLILFPTSIHGQNNYWQPTSGPSGIKIESLALDTLGNIYAGSDTSGIYYSTNAGNNWTNISRCTGMGEISRIIVTPQGDLFVGSIFIGNCFIYKSSNQGKNWELVSDSAILLTINHLGYIFAGGLTTNSLLRSIDHGYHWEVLGNLDSCPFEISIGLDGKMCAYTDRWFWFSSDDGLTWVGGTLLPAYPEALIFTPKYNYLVSYRAGQSGNTFISGIVRSTDGITFTDVHTTLHGVLCFASNKAGYIFGANFEGVFRSIDDGLTWSPISNTGLGIPTYALAVAQDGYAYAGTNNGVYRSIESTTSIKNENSNLASEFKLYQNYPNPFNSMTSIKYQIQSTVDISLRLYDLIGREVLTLVNEKKEPGIYVKVFNPDGLSSGIYLYKLQAGDLIQTKKLLLLK